jgi:protein-disulfide isomerase
MLRFRRILFLCFGLVAGPAQAQDGGVSLAGLGHDLGIAGARVFIVEFADFGCGYCAKFERETYPKIDSVYISKGVVRWKMVPFVTGMFKNSREVAEAAECSADQGAFWKMHDLLYEQQKEWKKSSDIQSLIQKYATQLKLDRNKLALCQKNPETRRRIARNDAIAQQLGITGTPTFFVNGRRVPGAIPFPLFQQVISEALLR